MITHAYVVESPAFNAGGERVGTWKLYVKTEARAKELATTGKTYRRIPAEEIPTKVLENLNGGNVQN